MRARALKQVTSSQLSARYRTFNQMQMLRLEKRWLETDPACDQKGGTCLGNFSQAQPPKIKRNEMMLIPKWRNYPGN